MKDSRIFMTLTHLTPHFSPPFVFKHHRTAHFPTHRTNGGLSKGRSDGSRRAIPIPTEKRHRSRCRHRSHQRDGANDAGKNGAFSNRRKESSVVVLVILKSLWFFVFVYIYIFIHQGDDSNQPIRKTFGIE